MVKARKTLQNIIPYQTDKYKQSWRLKLDSNENIYGASASVLSAIKNFDAEDISLYPVYGKLIDKIAQKYNLNNDNILLSNGCDEGLSIILNTYLETEDEILSYNPSFSMPQIYAKIIGANIKLIEYDEKFVFNIEKIKNNISDKTKIVYLATPDNPTGCTVKASVVEMLLKEFPSTLFIIDCTYINFAYSVAFEDYIDLVHKYNNVAILKSFSKDFALAGLRLGFCVADSEIIENLKKVASPYNVNAIAVNCAIAAMNEEKKFEEIKEMNANSREMLFEGLLKAGFKPYKVKAILFFVISDRIANFTTKNYAKTG